MIFILEDNPIMAECITTAIKKVAPDEPTMSFPDAISAIQALSDDDLPKLIFLDILLTGPNGFTFLNELASYQDTAQIPTVIISSLDFKNQDLSAYNVVGTLQKEQMLPADIQLYVKEYL